MTIQEKQAEIVDEFSFFDDWQERYEYLIQLGNSLSTIPDDKKNDALIVKGCQSNVWLDVELKEGKIYYTADSDAILPKGIAALLIRVYSGQTPEDILNSDEQFIEDIGLKEFLSPTRANGLLAMIKQIKFYAIALKAKTER
ncbi:SufE family protein [Flavobacteriaceae bacterium Ap0902]|nr:SufE family protein [Flavobacteriaceae bacterium Ap0902]